MNIKINSFPDPVIIETFQKRAPASKKKIPNQERPRNGAQLSTKYSLALKWSPLNRVKERNLASVAVNGRKGMFELRV